MTWRRGQVWLRNFFLAFFSLLFGLVTTLTKSRAEIGGKGFFYGYDGVVRRPPVRPPARPPARPRGGR